jgi:hypothetical protein
MDYLDFYNKRLKEVLEGAKRPAARAVPAEVRLPYESPLVTAFRSNLERRVPAHIDHAAEYFRNYIDPNRANVDHIDGALNAGKDRTASAAPEPPRFEEALRKLYDLQSQPPPAAAPVPLKLPNSAQLLAGGLAALLVPKFAATALASPFQAALVKHGEDEQRAALEAENATRAWQAQVGAAGDALSSIQRHGVETAMEPSPASVPNPASPGPELGESVAPVTQQVRSRLAMGDFQAAHEMAARAQAGLQGVRRTWISDQDALEIGSNEAAADRLRQAANDSFANLPKSGPVTRTRLQAQQQQNEAAWMATQRTMEDIDRQVAAVNDRLSLIGQGPGVDEIRSRLLNALDWLEALRSEKQVYLQRLQGMIGQVAKNL